MSSGQALAMMKLGKIVNSGSLYFKWHAGKVICLNAIGLSVWHECDFSEWNELIFTEVRREN